MSKRSEAFARVVGAGRPLIESTFDKTCAIRRTVATQDDAGNTVEAESTVATVGCRITEGEMPPFERVTADQMQSIGTHIIYMPVGADVRGSDHITSDDGREFNVIRGGGNSYELAQRVRVIEVNFGEAPSDGDGDGDGG